MCGKENNINKRLKNSLRGYVHNISIKEKLAVKRNRVFVFLQIE